MKGKIHSIALGRRQADPLGRFPRNPTSLSSHNPAPRLSTGEEGSTLNVMSIAPTLRGASRRAAQAALAASRGCAPGGDQILPRALLHRAIRPNNCDEGPRGFTDAAAVARRTLASMSAPLLAEVAPIDPPAPCLLYTSDAADE